MCVRAFTSVGAGFTQPPPGGEGREGDETREENEGGDRCTHELEMARASPRDVGEPPSKPCACFRYGWRWTHAVDGAESTQAQGQRFCAPYTCSPFTAPPSHTKSARARTATAKAPLAAPANTRGAALEAFTTASVELHWTLPVKTAASIGHVSPVTRSRT
jgi:hypothetical protein